MKSRNKKLVLSLLTAACISCGAIGLSACKTTKPETGDDTRIVEVYNSYVAYAEAKGETPLSYEDWLAGIKGENGKNGTDGQDGKDGATWIVKADAPAATTGKNGDLYLDTQTFNVYIKVNGSWSIIGSLKGANGSNGSNGSDGQAGVGITDIQSEVVSVEGKDYIKFTFILSEGNPIERLVELPASGGMSVEQVYAGLAQVPVGTSVSDAIRQITLSVTYSGNMNGQVSLDDEGVHCDLSAVDFNTVGLYAAQGDFKGVDFTLRVAVIDPEQQGEPSLLGIVCESDVSFYIGMPESELINNLLGTYAQLVYSNGNNDYKQLAELGITEETVAAAIAEAGVNLQTEGEYNVSLACAGEYAGNTVEVKIKVIDMSGNDPGHGDNPGQEAQLVGVLTGTDTKSAFAYNGNAVSAIALYSDGSAQLALSQPAVATYSADDGEPTEPDTIWAEFELDDYENPTTVIIKSGNVKGAIFAVDTTNADVSGQVFTAEFADYEFTEEPYNTFSGVNADGESFTLALYPNGLAEMTVGGNSFNVGAVIGTEEPEDGADTATVYVQVPDVEFFTAEVPADMQGNESINNLAPVVSDPNDNEGFCGVWTAVSAITYKNNGSFELETGWTQVLLTVKSDGTVNGMSIYNGRLDRVRFTYVEENGGLRLTMVYSTGSDPSHYGSVLLTLDSGELTYDYTPNPIYDGDLARGVASFIKK